MARRRGSSERKCRTREHVLADLSANYVEKQALLCGFAVEVSIPCANVLDRHAMRELARVKNGLVKASQGVMRHDF